MNDVSRSNGGPEKKARLETATTVERHYWKAVVFLVILILIGTGFWGLRRFHPALFLGKPDLIAVPNTTHPQGSAAPASPAAEKRPPKVALLNINTASAEELQTLPNIGARMAQRIVEYRKVHGNFSSVDELQKVKGIGTKTLEKLKPFVGIE